MIVLPCCIIASVVAPQPVLPLSSTQFDGSLSIQSPLMYLAPFGAFTVIVSLTFVLIFISEFSIFDLFLIDYHASFIFESRSVASIAACPLWNIGAINVAPVLISVYRKIGLWRRIGSSSAF